MRRLLPEPAAEVDPYEEYRVVGPWLRVGMVASLDGSVTDEERWSNRLGGKADQRVFRTLRALADGIVVGAGTVRTGRLGPARLPAELAARRGRPPAPIIVVSRSLDLDFGAPLFTESEPILVTSDDARPPAHVRVVSAGEGDIDLPLALHRLQGEHGFQHLLCEGGPALATALLEEDLVDELCVNIAPTLIGSRHHTRMVCDLERRELSLDSVYTDEGVLFLRYLTNRPRP
ncbi:dihydrofolate reductase family protein [Actinocorallia sp. B10E7]|uniref:dihydrofolate reductase family protein n=1 Tax=Actinocorallia sp. B10E7 TaxID=3153558 RepID=UPI00325DBA9F